MLILLQLYAAHLCAEFILQALWAQRWEGKPRRASLALAACEYVGALALVNVGLSRGMAVGLLLVALAHGVTKYIARWREGRWVALLVAQLGHLAVCVGAAIILGPITWTTALEVAHASLMSPRTYLFIAVYVGVVFAGGALVQKVAETFLDAIDGNLQDKKPGLPRAGTYIGWVERLLVLTFVLAGYNEAIAFLLAVKALVRFPEIKEDTKGVFGEYFLVGTFTSMSIALIGGFLLKLLSEML